LKYWRRENGDWIIFEKHEGEQTANYFDYRFALFFSQNMSGWMLLYDMSGHSIDGGECARWDIEPTRDEVQFAVEEFLLKKAV
jgi:hypothetical protein